MQSSTHASESQTTANPASDLTGPSRPLVWHVALPWRPREREGGREGVRRAQLRGPSCLLLWASSPGTRTRPCWWSSSSRRPRRSRSSSACSSAHRWGRRSRSGPACCWKRRGGGLVEATVCVCVCVGRCLVVNTVKDCRTLGAKRGQ